MRILLSSFKFVVISAEGVFKLDLFEVRSGLLKIDGWDMGRWSGLVVIGKRLE